MCQVRVVFSDIMFIKFCGSQLFEKLRGYTVAYPGIFGGGFNKFS